MSDKYDDLLGKPETHESYALVSFSRTSCNGEGATLFGSSIKHNNTIRLRICKAELRRNLNSDNYYGGERLIEVEMSPTQFAEAITSMNCGDGVPCTLNQLGRQSMERPKGEAKREQFVGEFKESTDKVASQLDELAEFANRLNDKPTVTKGERAELLERIRMVRQKIESDLPFVATQFNKQVSKTVHEAKGEIEAHFLHQVLNLGLAALQEQGLEGLSRPELMAIEGPGDES